jgi:hypothetical protein
VRFAGPRRRPRPRQLDVMVATVTTGLDSDFDGVRATQPCGAQPLVRPNQPSVRWSGSLGQPHEALDRGEWAARR